MSAAEIIFSADGAAAITHTPDPSITANNIGLLVNQFCGYVEKITFYQGLSTGAVLQGLSV